MRRPSPSARPALLPVGLALLLLAAPVVAGEVYRWKDAKGVTHFSDSPPPWGKHSTHKITQRAPQVAAAKPAVNADCSNARSNLTLLQGTGKLGVDDDKDGKIDRELTATERAARTKIAEGHVEIYCSAPAAAAVTTTRK